MVGNRQRNRKYVPRAVLDHLAQDARVIVAPPARRGQMQRRVAARHSISQRREIAHISGDAPELQPVNAVCLARVSQETHRLVAALDQHP